MSRFRIFLEEWKKLRRKKMVVVGYFNQIGWVP